MGNNKRKSSTETSGEKFLQQRVRQPSRMKISGRISNSTTIRGTELIGTLTTNASGAVAAVIPLIGGATIGMITAHTPLQSVAKLYNQFVFQSSLIRYIPSVGLNSPGNVTIAFLNNTEAMSYVLESGRTFNELQTMAFGQSNAVTHPVWHEFTYAMNLPARRKRFDINATAPTLTIDTIERDCQGVFLIVISGATATTEVCIPRRESAMYLEGLSTNVP